MPAYRIYVIDGQNHVLAPPNVVECNTDDEALAQASQLVDGHDVELWQDNRLIARLPHKAAK